MGVGDWNDGMNRVGREGRGESVWMGFFLIDILGRIAPLAEARGDADRADRYRQHRDAPRARPSTPTAAGGTAPGTAAPTTTTARRWARPRATSARSTRSLQAWSVLSGAAPPERAELGARRPRRAAWSTATRA